MTVAMYSYKTGFRRVWRPSLWLTGLAYVWWLGVVVVDVYFLYIVVTRGMDWLVVH